MILVKNKSKLQERLNEAIEKGVDSDSRWVYVKITGKNNEVKEKIYGPFDESEAFDMTDGLEREGYYEYEILDDDAMTQRNLDSIEVYSFPGEDDEPQEVDESKKKETNYRLPKKIPVNRTIDDNHFFNKTFEKASEHPIAATPDGAIGGVGVVAESVEEEEKYICLFPTVEDGSNYNSEDITSKSAKDDLEDYKLYAEDYNLEVLGLNEFEGAINVVIKGTKRELERFADEALGYDLHPDYLYKENEFAGDIIKESLIEGFEDDKHYQSFDKKVKELGVTDEEVAKVIKIADDYEAKANKHFITYEQMEEVAKKMGLKEMSDKELARAWKVYYYVLNREAYTDTEETGIERWKKYGDAVSAFAEVINAEARERKAKGNYAPRRGEKLDLDKIIGDKYYVDNEGLLYLDSGVMKDLVANAKDVGMSLEDFLKLSFNKSQGDRYGTLRFTEYEDSFRDIWNSTSESLTEAPDEYGLPTDDEIEAELNAERERRKAQRDTQRQSAIDRQTREKEAQRIRDEQSARLKPKADEVLDLDKSTFDSVDEYFYTILDILVPDSGKCDSVAGELLRALNKIIYRNWNDGDYFYFGYGLETCGSAAQYIMNNGSDKAYSIIENIIKNSELDDNYIESLNELTDEIVKFITDDKPELLTTINDEDMLRCQIEFTHLIPKDDVDVYLDSGMRYHLDKNISENELIEALFRWGYVECPDFDFNDVEIYLSGDDLVITDVPKVIEKEVENAVYNGLDRYEVDLDNQYGDMYLDDEDDENEGEDDNDEE